MPNIFLYVLIFLALSTAGFYGAYQWEAGKVDKLEVALQDATKANEQWKVNYGKLEASSKEDCRAATAMLEDKVQLNDVSGSLIERLQDVYKEPQYPSTPATKKGSPAAPHTAPDEVEKDDTRYASLDAQLHPDVGLLLDEAYCTATTSCLQGNPKATSY